MSIDISISVIWVLFLDLIYFWNQNDYKEYITDLTDANTFYLWNDQYFFAVLIGAVSVAEMTQITLYIYISSKVL